MKNKSHAVYSVGSVEYTDCREVRPPPLTSVQDMTLNKPMVRL